jgi:hypothetical protein
VDQINMDQINMDKIMDQINLFLVNSTKYIHLMASCNIKSFSLKCYSTSNQIIFSFIFDINVSDDVLNEKNKLKILNS